MPTLCLTAVASTEAIEEALGRFCENLSEVSGLTVTGLPLRSYTELIDSGTRPGVDLYWAPPLVAVQLENRNVAVPLVAVTRSTRSSYHSALFTLSKGPLRTPADMQGVTVAWVSRESASGYFVPRWHLRSLGVSLKQSFSREIFCESHQAVTRAVLDGEADVGATHVALEPGGSALARAPWLALGARPSSVRVLLLVGPIPGDVIAAAEHVPLGTRQRLTAALLSMHDKNAAHAFDARRFEPVPDGHLRLLKRLYAYADA